MKRSRARKAKTKLTEVISASTEGGFIAFNPDTGTTTQGETVDDAFLNLKVATELYLEEMRTGFSFVRRY